MNIKYLKKSLVGGIVGGLIYALFMGGFDYFAGNNFNINKFIFDIIGFGLFQALFFNYNFRKNDKKTQA